MISRIGLPESEYFLILDLSLLSLLPMECEVMIQGRIGEIIVLDPTRQPSILKNHL